MGILCECTPNLPLYQVPKLLGNGQGILEILMLHLNPTTRIPNSCCCLCVTKTVTWQYLREPRLGFPLSDATLRGSHVLSARRAQRTRSRRPEGPQTSILYLSAYFQGKINFYGRNFTETENAQSTPNWILIST